MGGIAKILYILILSGISTPSSAQLPPEIMADAYLLQVEQAVRDGDLDRGRTVIHKIRTLKNQNELDLEVEFYYRYGKAADALGMSDVALDSVVKYLAAAGREGQHYGEALALMNSLRVGSPQRDVWVKLSPHILADANLTDAEQAILDGNLDRARTAIRDIRALQEQHELDLLDEFHFRYAKAANSIDLPELALESVMKYLAASGRERQHYVGALELMNRAQFAVSCRGWDTEEYFKTATLDEVSACLDTGIDATMKDESGADPRVRDNDKQTPLLEASKMTKNPEVIEYLLNAGADKQERDNDERTPLHLAAKFNNTVAIAALIEAGADLEVQDENERTPLHYAAEQGHPDAIELLLKAGANRARVKPKWTALHWAVSYNGDPVDIEDLLKAGAKLNARDDAKWRPLHVAAKFNKNPEVIRLLVTAGADLKAKNRDKWTPLHVAAAYNENPDVAKAFIQAGADVNSRAKRKWTPLHAAAAHSDNPDVVQALIEAGADPNARADFKGTALHWAAWYSDNPDVVHALIEAGADPNARANYKVTALHWAARFSDNPDVVQALIKAGADPNARDDYKRTPLHRAARDSDHPDVLKVLIDASGDPNARDNHRSSPLHYAAAKSRNPAVVEVLLHAGADWSAKDVNGWTPLHRAEDNKNFAVAKLLIAAGATRTKSQKEEGTDWGKVAVGVLGAAAIAHAGKDAPQEAVDQAISDWAAVMAGVETSTSAPTGSSGSSSQSQAATSEDPMQQALQNMEAVCGEKYQSGFAANDHARFYCLAAFGDYCALKRAPNEQARTQLRASLTQNCAVLTGIGAVGKCGYCR